MKKLKGVLLSLLLCCCLIVPIFAFAGCGTDPETVTKSLDELAQVFKDNSTVFVESKIDNFTIPTKYKVEYGYKINVAINSKQNGFEELDTKYNVIFAFANEFIETYKSHLPKPEDEIDGETSANLETLNKGVAEYIDSINEFVRQKSIMETYYNTTEISVGTGLRAFERSYGDMIEKALVVSTTLADILEHNNIMKNLAELPSASERTMIVEGFIRSRLLPVYSNLMISEIKNKIWWDTTENEDNSTKGRISAVLDKVEDLFSDFKEFVKSIDIVGEDGKIADSKVKTTFNDKLALKPLVEGLVEPFVKDVEQYQTALSTLDIQKLSVDYRNNLNKYMNESNEFAPTYLNKIEDFFNLVLGNFQNNFYGQVFAKPAE